VDGGACGSDTVGFKIVDGPVSGQPSLTWSSLVCLTTDTGSHTTDNFYNDLVSSAGGDESITIATANIGGSSNLTIAS
jgi:hypothetical protein